MENVFSLLEELMSFLVEDFSICFMFYLVKISFCGDFIFFFEDWCSMVVYFNDEYRVVKKLLLKVKK